MSRLKISVPYMKQQNNLENKKYNNLASAGNPALISLQGREFMLQLGKIKTEGIYMLKKISFHWKLYITYSVIISLVLSVALFGFYYYNARLLDQSMQEASVNVLNVAEDRMNEYLQDMDKQLSFFHVLPEFLEHAETLLQNDEKENFYIQNPLEAVSVQRIFLSVLVQEENGSSISFVGKNGNNIHASVIGNYQEVLPNDEMLADINVPEYLEEGENCYYLFPHEDYWGQQEDMVISVYRPVHDMFQDYGLLVYDKSCKELNSILSIDGEEVFLIDRERDLWYSTKNSDIEEEEKAILRKLSDEAESGFLEAKGNYNYYYCHSDLTGWTLVLKNDIGFYVQEKERLLRTILGIFVGSLCLILFFLFWVSQSLTAPLRQLKEKLEKRGLESKVNLEVVTDNNEVTMLSETIENILNQIHIQNQKLISMKELALKAHMNALEAQMNPHFLYNTLSVIGTYGLENGNLTVARMCGELSNLLRYSMNYQNKTVSLQEELDNIRDYLHIMEMRYEHMLECTWDLAKMKEDIQVPKLILQPIVENCFKHGFKDVPPVWKIKIHMWFTEEMWYVAVENNGTSFDEKTIQILKELQRKFKDSFGNEGALQELMDGTGVGLKNTMIRMHVYYQGKEHLRFFTEQGITVVELGGMLYEGQDSSADRGG